MADREIQNPIQHLLQKVGGMQFFGEYEKYSGLSNLSGSLPELVDEKPCPRGIHAELVPPAVARQWLTLAED